jgi:hypothetical protein
VLLNIPAPQNEGETINDVHANSDGSAGRDRLLMLRVKYVFEKARRLRKEGQVQYRRPSGNIAPVG